MEAAQHPDSPAIPQRESPVWLRRSRVVAGAALVWAMLHLAVGPGVLPPGVERPPVLSADGIVSMLLFAVALGLGSFIGGLIAGNDRPHSGLFVVMLGVAVWIAPGGTIDSWLRLSLERPDESASPAYARLFIEYVYLLIPAIAAIAGSSFASVLGRTGKTRLADALGLSALRTDWKSGLQSLAVTCGVGAFGVILIAGPRVAETHRGQVYFAVGVAFAAAVFVASKVGPLRHLIWHLASPFVVGLVGLVWAVADPTLPGAYKKLNNLPAQGLVRALPVEMISVGFVAVLFAIRRLDSNQRTERPPGAAQ